MRKLFWITFAIIFIAIIIVAFFWIYILYFLILFFPLFVLGLYNIIQKKRNILRNFPIIGYFRYLFLDIAPEIHQYFVEGNTEGTPFNKNERTFIYDRSERKAGTHPFGTELDIEKLGYEWIEHSIFPSKKHEETPRITIGNKDCKKKYYASLLNVSAMSFGALSNNAVRALNLGAKIGGFYQNTGEGALTPYHLQGGDLVLQLGTGYFGCRSMSGDFSEELFKEKANIESVKMIEIKLSQGAKPGHGGILPADKNTKEIAEIRNVKPHTTVYSPPYHTAFDDSKGLIEFVKKLRDLSGGKPIGFKLCIGKHSEFIDICKAMIELDIYPDFITIDGAEGGTGAAPLEFSNYVGTPLEHGLVFVVNTLMELGIKDHIKIIASGKVSTGFGIVRNLALGADLCNSARAMMMSLGCIQALKCDNNTCPTGVATQDPRLVKALNIKDKKQKAASFHYETVESALELIAAMGLDHPSELRRNHIQKRVKPGQAKSLEEIFPYPVNKKKNNKPNKKKEE
ncbi:MAG: FMN-binding glutamate synthase family protein [Hyphomicrobiales bacterium]